MITVILGRDTGKTITFHKEMGCSCALHSELAPSGVQKPFSPPSMLGVVNSNCDFLQPGDLQAEGGRVVRSGCTSSKSLQDSELPFEVRVVHPQRKQTDALIMRESFLRLSKTAFLLIRLLASFAGQSGIYSK